MYVTASRATADDVRATVAAREELGRDYDEVLTDSLVQRLDAQLDARPPRPSALAESATIIIALGSMGLGVVFALVAQKLGAVGGTLTTLVAWACIVLVNLMHARRHAVSRRGR